MVDRRPRLIARCAGTDDVVAAVRFAREHGLEIGVRCGGHSVLGLSVPEGGLMIDLRPMGAVRVDPEARRAWVQGGALLGALDRASQRHGLATTAGNVSHTGVGGLTLGGGMGWLARQHGLSCDNVCAFEMVTADGDVVRATETDHAELFWGLRGGGGNFGIVTEFEFRLHRTGTRALLADFFFPVEDALPVFQGWRDLNATAPRAATFTAWVGETDASFLPSGRHGRPLASVGFVWAGDPDEGRKLLPSLRSLGRPVAERVEELSYLALQKIEDSIEGHALRRYWKGHYFAELPDEAIQGYLSRGVADGDGELLPYASLQAYGGAIADVPDEATAFSQRDAMFEFVAAARWTDPARGRGAHRRGAPLRRRARAVRHRGVRQRDERRGSGRGRTRLPAGEARPPHRAEGRLGPRQRLPPQPEHPAERRLAVRGPTLVTGRIAPGARQPNTRSGSYLSFTLRTRSRLPPK